MREVLAVRGEALRSRAMEVRRRALFSKRLTSPGAFEVLGSFDAGQPEAMLFMNPIYRGLMNLLILEAWTGEPQRP